jgi:hypothetical protein
MAPQGSPTQSSTSTFTEPLSNNPAADAGIFSVGSWASNPDSPPAGYWTPTPVAVLERIPAPINPVLPAESNPTVTRVSSNSFSAPISLGDAETLQLSPSFENAQGQPVAAVAPNAFSFVYTSRNVRVAEVSDTGLVTPTGRGECCILIGSARTANLPYAGAAPPAGQTGCETYCELNVTVLA